MRKIYIIPLIILGLASMLYAQGEDYTAQVVDVRSAGMGRTHVMSVRGSNALFSNPAILAEVDEYQLNIGGRISFGFINDEYRLDRDDYYEDYDSRYSLNPKLNQISFAMPIVFSNPDVKLAFGFGYHSYLDRSSSLVSESTIRDGDYYDKSVYRVEGGLNMLALGAAVSYLDKYFVGFAASESFLTKEEFSREFNVFLGPSAEMHYKQTSFVMLGAKAKPIPKLSVGLMYRFEFDFDESLFDRGETHPADIVPLYSLKFPAIFGFGVEYNIFPKVIIAAEYQHRPFSDFESSNERWRMIDDGYCLRFGAEFKQSSSLAFRLGVFRDAVISPLDPEYIHPATFQGFTGGCGFVLSQFDIDLSLEYANLTYDDSDNYSSHHFRIGTSAQYRF